MTYKGHIMLALSVSLPIIEKFYGFDTKLFYTAVGGIVLGSVFPDIDEPHSYIGRRFPIISDILYFIFGHRGFTHTFAFFLIVFLFAYFFSYIEHITHIYFSYNQSKTFLYSFAFGILLHDIGDMFTKSGIKGFFYPFWRNKTAALLPKRYRFVTGSMTEWLITLLLILIIIFEWKI